MADGRQKSVTGTTGATSASGGRIVAPGVTLNVENDKLYNNRFFYNLKVVPSETEALLARRCQNCTVLSTNSVRSRVFSMTGGSSVTGSTKVSQHTLRMIQQQVGLLV